MRTKNQSYLYPLIRVRWDKFEPLPSIPLSISWKSLFNRRTSLFINQSLNSPPNSKRLISSPIFEGCVFCYIQKVKGFSFFSLRKIYARCSVQRDRNTIPS